MDETRTELEGEVRRLREQLGALHSQMRSVATVLTVLVVAPVPVLVALSMWSPAYRPETDRDHVVGAAVVKPLLALPGEAADAGNGVVQVFAVLTIITLVAMFVAAVVVVGVRSLIPAAAVTGAVTVLWIGLLFVVRLSGGGGYIGELGVELDAGAWWPGAACLWTAVGIWLLRRLRT